MSLLSAILQEADKARTEEFAKHRGVLDELIKEIGDKIQMLSWSLQEIIIENHVNYAQTKSLEQIIYRSRKENIIKNYEELTGKVETLRQQLEISDEEFLSTLNKLTKSFENFQDMCLVAEAKRELEKADHAFTRYQYCEGILAVSELKSKLKNLKLEGKLDKAVKNIISQAETQFSIYAANLSLEWEDIFSWSEKEGLYHLTYSLSVQQSDPVVISNVLKSLYATERLNEELEMFSHFFIDKILHNIIRHNCNIFTEDIIAPDHTIVFNIKIDLEDNTKPSFQAIFNNLMAVFDFLQLTLGSRFDADKKFLAVFSDSLRARFFTKIIDDCIRNNLPSCDSTYQNYKNLVVELDSFNKFLIELQFVDAESSPLNHFVNDTECVLYNKKCDKLLSDIKKLLNQSLTYCTVEVGTNMVSENESVLDVTDKDAVWDLTKPLFLPKCVISQNVKDILTTIMEHLEESTKLPEKYVRQLISYIKSIAVMYQCVVPKKFQINLEHCPLDIALFFNNCFYLAHGLLGPPWRALLPPALARDLSALMMESIQDLRVLGLEKISLYLQKQKSVIVDSIIPEEPMQWTEEVFEKFDGAINDALILMKNLKSNWYRVLPSRMYDLTLCMLIEALCQAVLQRIFGYTQAVKEHLVYLIAVRLEVMNEDIVSLFEEPIDFTKKISIWSKFVKLPQVLKAQLLELSRLWNQDKQLSLSYTCEEVRQIIKMRFPNDKYRLKILMEIQ